MHLERESISLQSGDPELPKTHPLYRLATAASDVSPHDWLQLIGPYDATGEAETKGWKVTQCLRTNLFTIRCLPDAGAILESAGTAPYMFHQSAHKGFVPEVAKIVLHSQAQWY
ncbi:hypothetical protein I79_009682 [Cricetulus griseus]|uniref:Uncharacterized protein n=1 Tax=Cricetulus griseus TaxID=10029 RepID=G3HGF6_CRIGR|nr:hypothetical protein I79_009682 [Cricetulus griseus]